MCEKLPREWKVVVANFVSHVKEDGIHTCVVEGAPAPDTPNVDHQVPENFKGTKMFQDCSGR